MSGLAAELAAERFGPPALAELPTAHVPEEAEWHAYRDRYYRQQRAAGLLAAARAGLDDAWTEES